MLPVIVTAPYSETWLCPNDLRADVKAGGLKRSLHGAGMPVGMPAIGDVSWEKLPSRTPIDPIVVLHLPDGSPSDGRAIGSQRLVAPVSIVFHPVGRIS